MVRHSWKNGWYPIKWYCSRLGCIIECEYDAIPVPGFGFLCECVDSSGDSVWVKGNSSHHRCIMYKRFDVYHSFKFDVSCVPVSNSSLLMDICPKCCYNSVCSYCNDYWRVCPHVRRISDSILAGEIGFRKYNFEIYVNSVHVVCHFGV